MNKNKKLYHWKYQLYFGMREAYEAGENDHPQLVFKKFIEEMKKENIEIQVLSAEGIPIGDCWLFLIKCDTPWLGKRLPSYLFHQGFGNDKEGLYE